MRYTVRTGCQWRFLPYGFPPSSALYQQARRWFQAGVFETIAHDLRIIARVLADPDERPEMSVDERSRRPSRTVATASSTMTNIFNQIQLEPSLIARRLLWHVLSIGRVSRDEPEQHPVRDKAGVFLFWVLSGRGELQVAKSTWELAPGNSCWLVDLAEPRTYIPRGVARLVTSGLRFTGPGLESWCEVLGGGGEFRLGSRKDILQLQRLQEHMMRLVARRPLNFEWELHELVTQALGRLLASRNVLVTPPADNTPKPVSKVLNIVLSDPARAWRAAELAKLAGISYSGLRSLFRQSQHESLSEFLQRTRLDQARLFLTDDRLTIKQIARHIEFSSEF